MSSAQGRASGSILAPNASATGCPARSVNGICCPASGEWYPSTELPTKGAVLLEVDPHASTSVGPQHADDVWPPNRCELARQMHIYDLHYEIGMAFYVRKCIHCGLTQGEVEQRGSMQP